MTIFSLDKDYKMNQINKIKNSISSGVSHATKSARAKVFGDQEEMTEEEVQRILMSIEQTFKLINEGKRLLDVSLLNTQSQVVLVIGQTGVGKSTLINYLSGAELIYNSDFDYLEVKNQVGKIAVGHGAESMTTVPNQWHDREHSLTYWDCPGFEDTKGSEQDIANAFYVQRLFQNAFIKLLVVVQASSFDDKRGSAFTQLIGKLASLLNNFSHFSQAITLVVSKCTKPKMAIIAKIKKQLEELTNLSPEQKRMMQFFVDNENRIELFPAATQDGRYGDEYKNNILRMLKETAVYVPRCQVNITVSDSSLLVWLDFLLKHFIYLLSFFLNNPFIKDVVVSFFL